MREGWSERYFEQAIPRFVCLDLENSHRCALFCKNEEDLVNIHEVIDVKIGDRFPNLKTRPWLQLSQLSF